MFKNDKSRARNLLILIGAVGLVAIGVIVIRLVSQPPADFNSLARCQDSADLANGFMVLQARHAAMDSELVRASLSGADLCRLTESEELVEAMPEIAPDGGSIYFAYESLEPSAGIESGVYRMALDGTNAERLTPDYFGNVGHPSSSPDGARIVFSATPIETRLPENVEVPVGDDFQHDLFVMSRDGEFLYPLVAAPSRQLDPVWSPDGTQVAYSQTDSSILPFDLYTISADGGEPTLLSSEVGSLPAWSPDSAQLVAQGMNGLIIVNVDDGTVTALTDDFGKSPVWAADDSIYYVLDGRVHRIQPDGSERAALTPDYGAFSVDVWMPGTQG